MSQENEQISRQALNRVLLIAGITLVVVLTLSVAAFGSPPGTADPSRPVYVRGTNSGFRVHPWKLNLDVIGFIKLHWRHWGTDRTHAGGRFVFLTHQRAPHHGRGKVRLSKIRTCRGRLVYSHVHWKARGFRGDRWQRGHFYAPDCSISG